MLGNASTSVNELDSSFRLLLLLNSLDLQLLHSSVTQLGRSALTSPDLWLSATSKSAYPLLFHACRGVRLNPEAVQVSIFIITGRARLSPYRWQVEVELLKQFSGDSQENSCLKSVSYTSGEIFLS